MGDAALPKLPDTQGAPTHIREPWKAFKARERNADCKREAVLQTAAHLFLERGYRKTSMSLLAARLQITKPALYYYFRNKEEILVECYRFGIIAIEALLDQATVSRGNGLDKVKAYVRAYATAVLSYDFGRCVAMLDDTELSPSTRREVRALKRRIDSALRGYIEEGIRDGSVAPYDAKLASFAMAGAINWIGTWYQPDRGLTSEQIAIEFAQMLTCGLGQRENAPAQPRRAVRSALSFTPT